MNVVKRAACATAVLMLSGLAACGGSKDESGAGGAGEGPSTAAAAAQITPEARQEAQQMFSTRCAVCHGAEGQGDGPGASGLNPKPRNFHDQAWQDGVADQEIETAIVYGGAAVGRSPGMVANPDLGSKPAVVAALREIIRNFTKQK